MKKATKIRIDIIALLNQLDEPADRIALVEKIGKELRQANSLAVAKDVEKFARMTGNKKDIDYSPVLKNK